MVARNTNDSGEFDPMQETVDCTGPEVDDVFVDECTPLIGTPVNELYTRLFGLLYSACVTGEKRMVIVTGGKYAGKTVMLSRLVCDLNRSNIREGSYKTLADKNVADQRNRELIYLDDMDWEAASQGAQGSLIRFFKDAQTKSTFLFTCRDISRIKSVVDACDPMVVSLPELPDEDLALILSRKRFGEFRMGYRSAARIVQLLRAIGEKEILKTASDAVLHLLFPRIVDRQWAFSRDGGHEMEFRDEEIRAAVSRCTGSPMGCMSADFVETLRRRLARRIRGQDEVIDKILPGIASVAMGLSDPTRPAGVFLFYGPSGCGKTETARVIADLLFGGTLFKEDMNLYQDKFNVTRIIGSPPGYVGHDDTPPMLKFADEHRRGVLLLDEIEKAHPAAMDMFMELLDTGVIRGNDGRIRDFRGYLIIFTSNVGFETNIRRVGFSDEVADDFPASQDRDVLNDSGAFRTSFLGRIPVVCRFNNIDHDMIAEIAELQLKDLDGRLKSVGIDGGDYSRFIDEVVAAYSEEFGARSMKSFVETTIKPRVIEEYSRTVVGGS